MKICNDVFWMLFGASMFIVVEKIMANAGLLQEVCK